jgi:hypothetical protein
VGNDQGDDGGNGERKNKEGHRKEGGGLHTFVIMPLLDPGVPMSELVCGKGRRRKGRKK